MTDVQGLNTAYATDNGMYSRNTIMVVSGTQDFPQDHWDALKIKVGLTAESFTYRIADKAF